MQAEMVAVETSLDVGNILWMFYDCLLRISRNLTQLQKLLLLQSFLVGIPRKLNFLKEFQKKSSHFSGSFFSVIFDKCQAKIDLFEVKTSGKFPKTSKGNSVRRYSLQRVSCF